LPEIIDINEGDTYSITVKGLEKFMSFNEATMTLTMDIENTTSPGNYSLTFELTDSVGDTNSV